MAVTVEFVTLGDASKKLGIPAPTLRLWTDELENNEVHFVKRNHRDERIYYENDLEIFAYMRDLKKEYRRKLQTKDIALMIYQEAVEENRFELRRAEDAPKPEPSHQHLELLNNKDIEQLMDSERVKQFMSIIVEETTKNIRNDLLAKMEENENKILKQLMESYEKLEKELKERDRLWEERAVKRDEMLMQSLRQTMENKKKWWHFWK